MGKVHLTKSVVSSLLPKDKRYYVSDKTLAGLQLHVTPSGSKTFYVRKKHAGRIIKVRIGRYPDEINSPARARELALPIISDIAQGINPNHEKRAASDKKTLDDLYNLFMDLYSRPVKKSWKKDEYEYKKYVPMAIRRKPLDELTKLDIKRLQAKLCNIGKPTANNVISLLAAIFNYCIDELDFDIKNPARIKKYATKSRKNKLTPAQIPDFFKAVDKMRTRGTSTGDYLLLLLYTGARSKNVREMEWGELDLENAVWHIPGRKTKNGEDFDVPLIKYAVEIIKGRPIIYGNPYVFPAPQKKSGFIATSTHWENWKRARTGLSVEGITIHDLRRSHGSWMADLNYSKDILKEALGQKSDEANDIYARVSVEPVREAKEATVAKILEFRKAE